jgi:hypothetical protein
LIPQAGIDKMTVTELGVMGVKPGLKVMDTSTEEGRLLKSIYDKPTAFPGGPSRAYYGLEVEDPSRLWAFFDFKSVEEHRNFAEK